MDESVGITVRDLRKTFSADGQEVRALDGVSVAVHRGEIVALLGPSGCGKTTTLRCVAGLEHADSGTVELLGKPVYSSADGVFVQPERRRIGMVFQSYALWPHMTVFDNVGYPLKCRGVRRHEIETRVREALATVNCETLKQRYPGELSGGQQQRIGLARALVGNPEVMLFDEPLSNLDAQLRLQMRFEILQLHERIGFTSIYVTHDQEEALTIASRIGVMRAGELVQLGTPTEVYTMPRDKGVASFLGTVSFVRGAVVSTAENGAVDLETPVGRARGHNRAVDLGAGEDVLLCVRPERVQILTGVRPPSTDEVRWVHGRLELAAYLGTKWTLLVRLPDGTDIKADAPPHRDWTALCGTDVSVGIELAGLAAVHDGRAAPAPSSTDHDHGSL